MALGDLYEASVRMTYNGEEMTNIFHFEHLESVGSAVDLISRIINQWITANWTTLVSLAVSFVEIAAKNLFTPSDAATLPVGLAGSGTGDGLPHHDAITVAFETVNPSFRQGRKAFGGITEGYGSDGVLDGTTLTAWNAFVSTDLVTPLIGTPNDRYQYVVIKRIKESDGMGGFKYRLPENSGEAVFSQVVSGVVKSNIRTQRSRDPLE